MPSDPAIIPNDHGLRVLDVVPPALDLRLVRSRQDRHVGPHHDPVPNSHEPVVEDGEVKVCVEARAEADVAAVVNCKGRLDEDIVAVDAAQDLAQHDEASRLQRGEVGPLERGREVAVVAVAPGAGFEAGGRELGDPGVVALCVRREPWL